MKRMIKRISLLTALVALFSLLSVVAYAGEQAEPAESNQSSFDRSLVFAPETDLTVYVDNQWSSALSNSYGYGDKVSLDAPTIEGKTFSHWTADGSIVSYANPLELTMNAHTTLYAVYANAAPEKNVVAGFTSITRTNDGGSISFQAIAYPNGGTVTGAGIVYSTSVTGDQLKSVGEDVTKVEAVSTLPVGEGNMQRQTAEIRENDAVIELDGWKVVLRFSNQPSGGAMKSVKDILLNQRIALQKPSNICNLSDNLV